MVWRAVIGIAALGVGALWIGQGIGAVHGSFMTGHSQYTGLGVVLVVLGAVMLVWARVVLRRQPRSPG